MQFWQSFARTPMEDMPDLVRTAEDVGFTGVTISDHLVRPVEINTPYPYSADGKPVTTTHTPFAEPWVLMTHLAGLTERLRFMPSVYVLPLRDPFTVAKSLGSTCVLTGERIDLGIGVGWMAEEFAMTGQDFSTRGKRTDEMLVVLRKLMTGEVVEHHGDFYDFPPVAMTPAPSAMPLILCGGESRAALRRAASLDGWLGVAYDYEAIPGILAAVNDAREDAGTGGCAFEIVLSVKGGVTPAQIDELESWGVTRLVLPPSPCEGATEKARVLRETAAKIGLT